MLYLCQHRRIICKSEVNSAKVQRNKVTFYQINKLIVLNNTEWDDTYPPMYTNKNVSGLNIHYHILFHTSVTFQIY